MRKDGEVVKDRRGRGKRKAWRGEEVDERVIQVSGKRVKKRLGNKEKGMGGGVRY